MQLLVIGAGSAAMVALPLNATLKLRRRGRADLAPWSRVLLAALASGVTLWALVALDEAADSMLAAHMLQHVLIGDLVPLLLVLAVRGTLLPHLLPRPAIRAGRRLGLHRIVARIARPAPAFVLWAVPLAVWHVPALYDRALENERLHAFEHLTFMFAGVLVWTVLLDPARRGLLAGWRAIGYAVALLAASGVLGNTLIISYRPLYPAYEEGRARFGLTPLQDQNLAGLVMMLEQLATLGVFAALTARRQLGSAAAPARHPLAT